MRLEKPIPVNELISAFTNGPDQALSRIIREQNRLFALVKQAVPSFLRRHCVACVKKEKKLILFTDSPVWASQFRFHGHLIVQELRRLLPFAQIDTLQPRILLPFGNAGLNKRHPKIPSPETIDSLRRSADCLPHPELKDSLRRLARTLEKARH